MDTNGGATYQNTTVTSYNENDIHKSPSYAASGEYPSETPVKTTRIVAIEPYFDWRVSEFYAHIFARNCACK